MHREQIAVFENGISFDVTPRPSLDTEIVVATFVDCNSERHKIELTGTELTKVSAQLLERIKSDGIPFVNKAKLYMNPSNPIFLLAIKTESEQVFAPPSTVSPFSAHNTYPSFL